MEENNIQVRTKFRFVKEKDLTTNDKHKEIGLFSISEKSLSIGIGGNSYIYLPSIEILNENFVNKISYTEDMINKADIEIVYTKEEIDEKIAQAVTGGKVDLSNYYTKSETYSQTEIDDKLLLKVDASLVYTKDEVDELIDLIPTFNSSLYYNKDEVDNKVNLKLDSSVYNSDKLNYVLKADMDNYYQKKDIDGKLIEKVDVVDYEADKLTFANKDELNLKLDTSTYNSDKTTFATKLELADKADNSKIGDLQNTGLVGTTVTELLTDAKSKIDSINTQGPVDLSNYYTKSETYKKDEIDLKLTDKLNNNALDNYYDKSYIDSDIATKAELIDKVSNSSLTQDYYSKSDIDSKLSNKLDNTALDNYYDNSKVYTKLEVDGKVDEKVAKLDYETDKLTFATKDELDNKADDSVVTELSNKLGNLSGTGLTGSTVTELLTDVKSRIDGVQVSGGQVDLSNYYTKSETYSKSEVNDQLLLKADAITVNGLDTRIGTLEGSITNKVEDNEYQTTKNKTLANESNISNINSKLGDLQNTGLTGSTVTELLTDAKSKIDNISIGNYYNKREVDDKLDSKLDASEISKYYLKTDTYSQLEADNKFALISVVDTKADDSKVGDLQRTGLTGLTVTELLTNAKTRIDSKASQNDLASLTGRVGTLEGEIANKLNSDALDDYYNESTVDRLLANKANQSSIGDLQNTGLTGNTVTELFTDTKTRIDNINIGNYYNKSETYTKGEVDGKLSAKLDSSTASSTYATKLELANKADSSLLDDKLDASTYNNEKSGFATTRSVEQLNEKLEKFNNSIRPVLMLSEDTSTIEGQSDTQDWLTQKLKTEKQLDPENGLVITTSDGDSYFYFDGQWVLRKTYKVGSVTNNTSGIVLGKDEAGHGYIKASDALDGTMVLVDYQDIVDSIGTKAESSTVNGLNTRIGTLEGSITNKLNSDALNNYYTSSTVDGLLSAKLNSADAARDYATKGEVSVKANQSSIGDLTGTGLTGSTVTELLTDAKTKINDINISNYYPINETYNKTEVNGFLTNKANDADVVKLTGDQTINGNKSFNGTTTFSTNVKMGYGGGTVLLTPEDNSTKILKFRDNSIGSDNKFNLDLENICGLTGIKDPASSRDAVPRDWANSQYLPQVSTNAVNTLQITNNAQKYFSLDYVTSGTGFRNYSGIRLRAKQGNGNFVNMWKLEYHDSDNAGIFMNCVGNKLSFDNPTKILNVSCEDTDSNNTAVSKIFLTNKLSALTGTYMNLTGDQDIAGVKNFTGTILSASSDRTYGSNRYYADNDSTGLGQPVFNTFGTKTEKQATIGFADASEQGKFEIKIENLPSRPNPKISLGNNTEIDGTLTVTGNVTAPNMPRVFQSTDVIDTTNLPTGCLGAKISRVP